MRRKSDRNKGKSPEKVEKPKRGRPPRRRKKSSSSSPERVSVIEEVVPDSQDVEMSEVQTTSTSVLPNPTTAASDDEDTEQVWHVKASESSGDAGEKIQKLKICLSRPSSTPERPDRSPRGRKKLNRTSQLEFSSESSEDKRKSRHRSRRGSTRDSNTEENISSDSAEKDVPSKEKNENSDSSSKKEVLATPLDDKVLQNKDNDKLKTPKSTDCDKLKTPKSIDCDKLKTPKSTDCDSKIVVEDNIPQNDSQSTSLLKSNSENASSSQKDDASSEKKKKHEIPSPEESINVESSPEIIHESSHDEPKCIKISSKEATKTTTPETVSINTKTKLKLLMVDNTSNEASDVTISTEESCDVTNPIENATIIGTPLNTESSDDQSSCEPGSKKAASVVEKAVSEPAEAEKADVKLTTVNSPPSGNLEITCKSPKGDEVMESNKKCTISNDNKVQKSPVQTEKSPIQVEKSLIQAEKSPIQAEKSPIQAEKSSIQAEKSPIQAEKSPIQVEKSPIQVEKSPIQVGKFPIHAEKSPGKIEKYPIQVEKSPIQVEKFPIHAEKSPGKIEKSPKQTEKLPKQIEKSPEQVLKSPVHVEDSSIESSDKSHVDVPLVKVMNDEISHKSDKNNLHEERVGIETVSNTFAEVVSTGNVRKRKWGSRSSKIIKASIVSISTDSLKNLISHVEPVSVEDVLMDIKLKESPEIKSEKVKSIEDPRKSNGKYGVNEKKKETKDILGNLSHRKISIVSEEIPKEQRPPSPPRYKSSPILYITNLVRPFTLPQLKNLLQRTGKLAENGFWIDKIKSRCFVQYQTEEQAIETRHALHGVTWPFSNPKTLNVDFGLASDMREALASGEDEMPISHETWPKEQYVRDSKISGKENDEKMFGKRTVVREWDVGKGDGAEQRVERPPRGVAMGGHHSLDPLERGRKRRSKSPSPARKFKKKEEEAPSKLLDDLFKKTKTTPCIYWLPLNAETILVKEEQRRKHMAEHERRIEELRRAAEQDQRGPRNPPHHSSTNRHR